MNVQDYRAAGYPVSNLIDQSAVERAEREVIAAYIVPLVGRVPTEEEQLTEPYRTAIMSLSFLLVQQRSVVATRAGGKTKMTPQSSTPTPEDILRQNAPGCDRALRAVASDKDPLKVCSDICGIYFKSNYFYTL